MYTLGAAVTTWKTRGEDVLWCSKENRWDGAKPIRAGTLLPAGGLVGRWVARQGAAGTTGLRCGGLGASQWSWHWGAATACVQHHRFLVTLPRWPRGAGLAASGGHITHTGTCLSCALLPCPGHLLCPQFFFGCLFVRAGIPLCFPQFGPGPLAQHGFARIATWEVVFAGTLDDGSVQTVMAISSDTDNEVIRQWGHAFTAEYAVTLSPTGLETSLRVVNTGTTAFDFTAAFHNYFAVTNVSEARVFGVESLPFQDRLADGATGTEAADGGAGYLVDKAVDKLYVGAPEELAVFDFGALKVLKIKKSATLPDVALWNPFGEGGCDGGWKNFVCVEPAAAADKVVLEAGEEWLGAQLLGVE